jgi:hypothetical protein
MTKREHELQVFCDFAAAANLRLAEDSASNAEPPQPDILCKVDDEVQYFEIAEVMWEIPGQPGETLAKGLHRSEEASRHKAALVAAGKLAEAAQIQTWGRHPYPPLLSLRQALEKKCSRSYETSALKVSLLLYYSRQTPFEPFDLLFDCTDILQEILSSSPFLRIWIYQHSEPYSYTVTLGDSNYEPLRNGVPVPLSTFATPASTRAVIGSLRMNNGHFQMMFDSRYAKIFNTVLASGLSRSARARHRSWVARFHRGAGPRAAAAYAPEAGTSIDGA